MSTSQQEYDRTEPATPYKLREAKKRGQVAKSLEVNSLVILSAAYVIFASWGLDVGVKFQKFFSGILASAHLFSGTQKSAEQLYRYTTFSLLDILWPGIFVLVLAALVANLAQSGFIFTGQVIKPDFKRLNPVDGFKRVFSKKMLMESVKCLLKIVFFGAIIYFTLESLLPNLFSMLFTPVEAYPGLLTKDVLHLFAYCLGALLIIALIDLAYTQWDFGKRMRMSRRELKEEVKRREGDPLIRAKLRALQKEALKRAASLRNIPDADILITNPTHLSIAIQYNRQTMNSPRLTAKGAGELALKMQRIAQKHHVVIIENKAVARQLFQKVDLDQAIPVELFPAIAKMLAWVYLQRNLKNSTGQAHYV